MPDEIEQLRERERKAAASIEAAYWMFTRGKKAPPPSSAVPGAYKELKEVQARLRELGQVPDWRAHG